jgi:hypothetical protein
VAGEWERRDGMRRSRRGRELFHCNHAQRDKVHGVAHVAKRLQVINSGINSDVNVP